MIYPFSEVYGHLLTWLLSPSAAIETNARTGHRVAVGHGATSFRISLEDNNLPTPGLRKVFPKSVAAEVAWFALGTQESEFITKHAPLWEKFVERIYIDPENDKLFRGKEQFDGVKAAYGYRWAHHFGRDQLHLGIEALRADPTDRRVYISTWDPALDGLGAKGQTNVPCPVGFNLTVLEGKLHSALFLRSSDVFVGLPYDVMGHALLMRLIANDLKVELGSLHVTLGHAHLYETHWEMAREALQQVPVVPTFPMPLVYTLDHIVAAPDAFVEQFKENALKAEWPSFNPKPFVVE